MITKDKTWYAKLETIHQKPKLTFDEQIQYLKDYKGIKFEIMSEEDAISFLQNNNYLFKVKAYAKNYSKYGENYHDASMIGKYCNLDFAYLRELSTLDMYLREKILKLVLNIEHYLKVQLLMDITENENEDGYKTLAEFFAKVRPDLKSTVMLKSYNSYCNSLVRNRVDFAIWEIVELLSFGDFIDLYNYYYSINPCSTKCMKNNLKSVQWLRNAAAHNNCIINNLNRENAPNKVNQEVMSYISKIPSISSKSCTKKMGNRQIHDFTVTLYVFNMVVSSEDVKRYTMKELKDLFETRFTKNKSYFENNSLITTNYDFVKKTIDYFYNLCNNI